MADVRVLKFDVGSSTDQALQRLQKRFGTPTGGEAMRRSLAIADFITEATKEKGGKVLIQSPDGSIREIVMPG